MTRRIPKSDGGVWGPRDQDNEWPPRSNNLNVRNYPSWRDMRAWLRQNADIFVSSAVSESPMTPEVDRAALALRVEGHTYAEISQRLRLRHPGVAREAVRRAMPSSVRHRVSIQHVAPERWNWVCECGMRQDDYTSQALVGRDALEHHFGRPQGPF